MRLLRSFQPGKHLISESILLFWMLFFAYQMTYLSGERGFFAFDQSIIFDGSYRIVSGQIPFKDFLIPFGPMVFWLQGLLFRIGGVSYASYIFGAAVINVLATAACYAILRLLFPDKKFPAFLGGMLTAIWFYPPFGTPWPEQTAFFFSLITILTVLASFELDQRSTQGSRILYIFAGLAAFCAFISKQNAGVFVVPLVALLMLARYQNTIKQRTLDFTIFSLGWAIGQIAFAIWLISRANLDLFIKHFLQIPAAEVSTGRLPEGNIAWLQTLFIGSAPNPIKLLSLLSSIIGIIIVTWFIRSKNKGTSRLLAAILAPALFLYHNAFLTTSNNQVENSLPFIGLIAGIGLGLLIPVKGLTKRIGILSSAVGFFIIVLVVWSSWLGANVAYSRQVHNIFKQSTFSNHLATGKLSAIKWGEPTRIGNLIPAEDIDRLVAYLDQRGENFFVFPDFTLFYGVLDVPSPQPLLWFHNGLTFSNEYDPTLDQWIISDLQKNQVRIIVIEEQSWFHTDKILSHFPMLQGFIAENFVKEQQIGNFIIYVQQDQ